MSTSARAHKNQREKCTPRHNDRCRGRRPPQPRRDVLKATLAVSLGLGAGRQAAAAQTTGGMPYRPFGRTGEKVSLDNGQSEIRMGTALRDGYRNKVFLMTKIDGRDGQTAQAQLDESLRLLQTDCIDLF